MAELYVDLNGSGPQQGYMNVYRTGQDQAGNFSSFRCIIRYLAKGYGSWGTTLYWSASGPWGTHANNFYIGSGSPARYNDIDVFAFDFNVGHDGEGYMGGFNWSLGMSTDHSSIGSGNGGASEGAAPRIPKRPSTLAAPTVTDRKPTSLTFAWSPPGDQRGAAVDAYLLRIRDASPSDGAGYTDHLVDAATLTKQVTGLTPGRDYWAGVYAHNGSADNGGYSNKSADVQAKTASGFQRWDGAQWAPTELLRWDGDSWEPAELQFRTTDNAWKVAG